MSDGVDSGVSRPAGISYLRIPADEPKKVAAFYETVFGWKVDADREDPSFEDGTGHVIGHIDAEMRDRPVRARVCRADAGATSVGVWQLSLARGGVGS